ncbi:hypothetical protein FQZ97_841580 [compost metagenome]
MHRAQQFEQRVQCNGLGHHRNAGQAHARGQRATGGHTLAEPEVLGTQPDGVAKGGGVLKRALQHLHVDDRHLGLAEADATGLGEFGHLGELFALQPPGERTQRKHARLVQFFGAELEHVHEAGFVQHRIGVGRADQRGHTAGHRRGHFALQHRGVFLAGLAQAHRQIHQAGRDHAATGVDGAVGMEVGRHVADGDDATGCDGDVGQLVAAGGRVHDTAVLDQDLHVMPRSRRRCPSPPCAPRYQK